MTVRASRGPARALVVGALLLLLATLAGCHSVPTGAIVRPEIYPDQTTPEAAWATYLWAWREGDVEVLERIYGLWPANEFEKLVERQGAEAVSDYYRRDATDLIVDSAEWVHYGEKLAYLRVVLRSRAVPRLELDFSFMERRPDDWCVSGKKFLR